MVSLFIGLPFVAPLLMHAGVGQPARLIYSVYSPLCHQMGFRSWFLFGEQSYYPLRAAVLANEKPFDEYVVDDPAFAGIDSESQFYRFSWAARSFTGNARMGYKVALCQRDTATYLALLAGGILFSALRRYIRPLRWQLFLLAILPMVLDGGYQLLASLPIDLLPRYESTPLLRTITGALYGFGLVWLAYPHIQLGMEEMEEGFRDKLTRANVIRPAQTGTQPGRGRDGTQMNGDERYPE